MRNIILTGMPSCGKSTLGVILAKILGMNFMDTDILIQEVEKRKLQDIIDSEGMEAFLEVEERVLSSVDVTNTVIATGGSAVYSEKAMNNLKKGGDVVYIRLTLEEIEKRLHNITTRGIAMKPGETLADLYNFRAPMYEKYADFTVETDSMGVEQSVEIIIRMLEKEIPEINQ